MTDISDRLSAALADRYRIERELGAGGMATVYLAEDLKHKRQVAIKVLRPELAAVLGADRFVQEIKTTAALQHPHILPLFDSGTAGEEGIGGSGDRKGEFLYYVMPYVEGETLREKLNRETQFGIDEAVRITREVADALDYAHRHGVIHRDIKPENILLHDGRPMVADFGIALALSAAAGGRMTETGMSLGTPHYMSPEQATAEKEITARSDVYSLASVLYEMLAGQPPHLGGSAQQIIMKIIAEPVAAVTSLRKSVPPNVAAALMKALEKLPADRFDSARAFADALANPSFTTATAAASGVGLAVPRSRRRAVVLAALALGVGLGVGSGYLLWRRAAPAGEIGRQQLTFSGHARRPAIAPAGDYVAYIRTRCAHGRAGACRSSLMLQEPGSTRPRALITDALVLEAPRWTHDGATVIVGGQLDEERSGVFAVPRLSGTVQVIGPRGAYDTHPAADSVLVVPPRREGPGVGLIISLPAGDVVDSLPLPFSAAADVAWGPFGRRIAASTGRGIRIVDRDGHPTAQFMTGSRPTLRWTVTGDGLLFFRVGTVKEDVFVRVPVSRSGRIAGEAEVVLPRVATLYRGEFDVARRTGRLAMASGDAISDIWSFDLTTTPVAGRRETSGTTWYGAPELSRDGRLIYYYRGDALGDNVYVFDRRTTAESALTAQQLPGGSDLRLSDDGRRLVYVHNTDSIARLESISFPSGRVTGAPADIDDWAAAPVPPRGILAMSNALRLVVFDSLGGAWRDLAVPDSLEPARFDVSPDGARAVFVANVRGGAFTPGEDRSRVGIRDLRVGVIGLSGGGARVIADLDPAEPTPGLTWASQDGVFVSRWLPADDRPSLWRLSPGSGRLERMAFLPAACEPQFTRVSRDGRSAACEVDDYRSDIWLVDVSGVSR